MTKREQLLQTITAILPCNGIPCTECELDQKVQIGRDSMALCTALEALQNGLTYFERGE